MNARLLTITDEDINLLHLHKDAEKNIPKELQENPQWITWKYRPADPTTGKCRKLPFGKDGTGIAWQKAHQWMSFDDALGKAQSRGHCGIGFVLPAKLSDGSYVVGLDHDNVTLADDDPRLQEIRALHQRLGEPYIEETPSGKGLRMLVASKVSIAQVGSSPNPLGGADELFCGSSKWLTVTGNRLGGTHVKEATHELQALAIEWNARLIGKKKPSQTTAEAVPLFHHLIQGGVFAWPDQKLRDGDGRERWMLKYAGHLHHQGHSQVEVERLALVANQEHYEDPLPSHTVLERCRRYKTPVNAEITGEQSQPHEHWPELKPLPPKYPSPPKLDTSVLPAALAGHVDDVATRMQVPPEMIATPLIISLGSVIGKLLMVQPKQNDVSWTEFPNLWGVGILPPAMLKSPALNAGAQFIQELETDAQRTHALAMADWENDERVRKLQVEHTNGQAKAAVKANNSIEAKRLLDEVQAIKPPVRTRYIIQDATPEARLEILIENPNGCMLIRDEFDGHMAQLRREGYENARAQELQFYDGKQDYANDRIKRGSSVAESPRLAVYGNLQPSKVEKYLRELKQGGNDDGYVQRLFQLGIQPTIDDKYVLTDTKAKKQTEGDVRTIFQAAAALPWERDALTGRLKPRVLKFDPDAQSVFNEFLVSLENKVRGGISNSMQASHIGKYRGTLAKLALIMAFAQDTTATVIDSMALNRAKDLLAFYGAHAKRIYAVDARGDIVSAHELLARIKKGSVPDGFNPRDDVMRREWDGLSKSAEVEGAISVLVSHGYLHDTEVPTTGRARRTIFIHPDIRGHK